MASRIVRHRAEVALLHHAAHVLGGRGLQPDHVGLFEQLRERLRRRQRCRRRSRSPRRHSSLPRALRHRARSGGTSPVRRPRTASRPARRAPARSSCRSRRTGSRAAGPASRRASICRRRAARSARCACRVVRVDGRQERSYVAREHLQPVPDLAGWKLPQVGEGAPARLLGADRRQQIEQVERRARARSHRAPARSDCRRRVRSARDSAPTFWPASPASLRVMPRLARSLRTHARSRCNRSVFSARKFSRACRGRRGGRLLM